MKFEMRKFIPARDVCLKAGKYAVLCGDFSDNKKMYVVGEKYKDAVDFIMLSLDRSTDNVLGYGIKRGCQAKYKVVVWDEEDIPEEYRREADDIQPTNV
ncbi:MAG: hypothetical protein U0K57_06035 [Lachnospiraceae bacterium]|nr:hypothetical protein [Lachnospiraceae bacterium]